MRKQSIHPRKSWLAIAACGLVFGCLGEKLGDDCAERAMCPRDGGDDGSGATGPDGGAGGDAGTPGASGASGTPGAGTGGTMSASAGMGGMTGAGGVADGGSGGMGEDCDTSASPSDEACLIADEFSVFVSPDGDDDNAGTMDDPVQSFARAFELADGKNVIACSGEYDQHVTVSGAARVFGRFDCDDDWRYAPSSPSTVAPSTAGYALHVDNVTGEVLIEDVQFMAQDASAAGESSIGGFVSESESVTLRRVRLEAGTGMDGESPTNPGFAAQFPGIEELQGEDGTVTAGGAKDSCTCPGGATSKGGDGGGLSDDGDPGEPDHAGPGGAGGVAASDCTGGGIGSGGNGAPGPARANAPGATTLGTLSADGFTPASGTDGGHGLPGQGGGGGAGKAAGGGGSGGCGGCGGMGGPGGGGGGASIALLVFESGVSLEASEIVVSDAGNGGSGAAGETGQQDAGSGGNGAGAGVGQGCDGGAGGLGGPGAPGGGGAGGISAGILSGGEATIVFDDETATETGNAGAAGPGGAPGDNDGIAGEVAGVLEL